MKFLFLFFFLFCHWVSCIDCQEPMEPFHLTLYRTKQSWNGADRTCQGNGQQLVNLKTTKKAQAVAEIIRQLKQDGDLTTTDDIWSGLYDSNPPLKQYTWSDCTSLTNWSNWARNEPNDVREDHCIRLRDNLQWRTTRCTRDHYFLCEHKRESCWFESYDESMLDAHLVDKGILNNTECRKVCLTFTAQGRECVALSIYNGSCHLFMSALNITTTPEIMREMASTTDIKRCVSYDIKPTMTSSSLVNKLPLHTCNPLLPLGTTIRDSVINPTTTSTKSTRADFATSDSNPSSPASVISRLDPSSPTDLMSTHDGSSRADRLRTTTLYTIKDGDASSTVRTHSSTVDTFTTETSISPSHVITSKSSSKLTDLISTHDSNSPAVAISLQDVSSTQLNTDIITVQEPNTVTDVISFQDPNTSADVISSHDPNPSTNVISSQDVSSGGEYPSATPSSTESLPIGFDLRGREIRTKCICRCIDRQATALNQSEALKKATAIKKSLIYITSNLTKMITKRISRNDQRISSQSIGAVAIMIVVLPLSAIVLADLAQPLLLCFRKEKETK